MNIGAKLTLNLMSYSFSVKTNLEAFFKTYTLMFCKLVGWKKFYTSFTFSFFFIIISNGLEIIDCNLLHVYVGIQWHYIQH